MKIAKATYIALIFAVATLFAACSHAPSTTQLIDDAREACNAGQWTLALQSLDKAAADLQGEEASPSQLANVAVLYLMAGENLSDEDAGVKAINAFARALEINRDSVEATTRTMSAEEFRYAYMLGALVRSSDVNIADEEYESEDIPAEDITDIAI